MAVYTFKCEDGHVFDKRVRIDDRNKPVICIDCEKDAVRIKEVYSSAFVIKD